MVEFPIPADASSIFACFCGSTFFSECSPSQMKVLLPPADVDSFGPNVSKRFASHPTGFRHLLYHNCACAPLCSTRFAQTCACVRACDRPDPAAALVLIYSVPFISSISMSTNVPVQNHEPAEETKREEEKEEEKEEMKEAKSEKEQKKEENKDQGKKEKKKDEKMKEEDLQGSWKDFFYNSRTGELLGRTASSWGLILLFYLIFYGFLAGMFCLTIWVMLQTLDENVPRHQDRVADPGLVIRPHATEIIYNRTDPINYQQYIQQLHDLLQQYNDSIQERNDLCLVGEYTDQDQGSIKKVCQFKRSILRQCSGLPDTSFGYAEGKPCIIIKMNRVIGLKPEGDPYINCTAKRDSPLQMQYFPPEGRLDKMFFPYYGKKSQPDYVQPLVAVKLLLTKDDYNIEQTVECKVEGSHLRNNDERDKYMGRVTFRVKVLQ